LSSAVCPGVVSSRMDGASFHGQRRVALEDIELDGHLIRAGEGVIIELRVVYGTLFRRVPTLRRAVGPEKTW